jgi:hypothetical protein
MEQTLSSEPNNSLATQEITRITYPNVHYRVHNSPPLVHIFSQVYLVHASDPGSLRYILILSSHIRLDQVASSLRFPH